MTQTGSKLAPSLQGFAASVGFLLFVQKFNNLISYIKEKRNVRKNQHFDGEPSLTNILTFIFTKTCSTREILTFLGLSACLVLRTFGSVWVSNHWGKIVSAIVERKWINLKTLIVQFAATTIGLSLLNALLKLFISLMKDQIREKITKWVHSKYMREKDMIYYKANRVNGIENLDHRVCSDIDKFANLFSELLSQSLKPIVDFVVYSVELTRCQGLTTPLVLYSWFAFSSMVSIFTLPPFSLLAAEEQKLEAQFIGTHSELITNCEQVAFLTGEKQELKQLNSKFANLINHSIHVIDISFRSEVVRQYMNKYFVTVIGLILVSRPLRLNLDGFHPDQMGESAVSQYFVSMWRNMESMSVSIQDLFELTNRMGKLTGLALRVKELMKAMEKEKWHDQKLDNDIVQYAPEFLAGDKLKFENVAVKKPDGTLLIDNLNLEVNRGERVLITGPNGCGKSSLFRVIRKLWPLTKGRITMPAEKEIYFLTQVNFVPVGSLRDLVIYPDEISDMKAKGKTDEDVKRVLKWAECSPELVKNGRAQLEFTLADGKKVRPELDDIRDWKRDLSPGQKQKIAFARLFYHSPSFVVLDECTNGISPDVEKKLYDKCSELQMGIFSISHKIELKEFHDFELHYKGDSKGGYDYLPCSETKGRYLGA